MVSTWSKARQDTRQFKPRIFHFYTSHHYCFHIVCAPLVGVDKLTKRVDILQRQIQNYLLLNAPSRQVIVQKVKMVKHFLQSGFDLVVLPEVARYSGAGLGEVGLVDQLTFTNSQLLLRGRGTKASVEEDYFEGCRERHINKLEHNLE